MIRSGLVGPKPRPRGVGDGQQVNSPAPPCPRYQWRGDATGQGSRPTGHGRCPLVACPGREPGRDVRGGPRACLGTTRVLRCPCRPEKPRHEGAWRPYRKPTPVGGENTPQAHERTSVKEFGKLTP